MNIEKIKDLLNRASEAYYRGMELIMTDDEFDHMAEVLKYYEVGYKSSGSTAKHYFPMYSLNKHYGERSDLGAPFDNKVVVSPKLDGAAVSLLYIDGELVQMLTRGDGEIGQIITDKAPLIPGIPLKDVFNGVCVQVTGEIIAPSNIQNSRNYVSGALALVDLEQFKHRTGLQFVAYDVQPKFTESYKKDLRFLENHGFKTIISRNFDFSQYPQDGEVVRVDSNETFDYMGYTSHHPRCAVAIKKQKEVATTKLLDVMWQVGKSGRVTPVAILEPVLLGGAVVSRATLNNINFIEALELNIGDEVEVIRSGDIIPCIVGKKNLDIDFASKE
jgi:NAD-dependent DNA ligase